MIRSVVFIIEFPVLIVKIKGCCARRIVYQVHDASMLDRVTAFGVIIVYILPPITQSERESVFKIIDEPGRKAVDIMFISFCIVGIFIISIRTSCFVK